MRLLLTPFAVPAVRSIEPLLPPLENGLAGGTMWVVTSPVDEVGRPPPGPVRLLTLEKFWLPLPGGL